MPALATCDGFLECVRKSGLVERPRLEALLVSLRKANRLPGEPKKLAGRLIREGLLTYFQAEQLLLGKHKAFVLAGKYKVLERLGVGGMGSVYLCEHLTMRRPAAVKVLPKDQADDPVAVERFYREARAGAALDHPNIVRAHDVDRDGALHFLVMEYVDGSSLQDVVTRGGSLSVQRAAHYIAQAAEGLQHAHEAGLVHRDVKPGNLLLDRSGVVKVLDLGLARFFLDDADDLTRRHQGKNVLGTADYLAPEQALDSHNVDIRADIYSLGCTFYFLLTGASPFAETRSVAQKLMWHQTRQPTPIGELRLDLPKELAAVVARMMAKDPAQRYQTPLEVIEALAPWTEAPIDPPSDLEMPHLCPAATRGGDSTMNAKSSTSTSSSRLGKGPGSAVRPPSSISRPSKPQTPSVAPPPRAGGWLRYVLVALAALALVAVGAVGAWCLAR